MKGLAKCEICNAETSANECVFATHKRVIEGEEHIYCCQIAQRKYTLKRKKGTSAEKNAQEMFTAARLNSRKRKSTC